MRRVRLLALLALTLPTAALAKSIDFDSGKFVNGTINGTFKTTSTIDVSITGDLNTVSLTTGPLTVLPPGRCPIRGATCFSFGAGGSVSVSHGGTTVFTDSPSGGFIIKMGDVVSINVALTPSTTVAHSGTTFNFTFAGHSLTGGSGVGVIPEPGTVGLLGTGPDRSRSADEAQGEAADISPGPASSLLRK